MTKHVFSFFSYIIW